MQMPPERERPTYVFDPFPVDWALPDPAARLLPPVAVPEDHHPDEDWHHNDSE